MKPGGIHAYQAITICIGALGLAIVPVVAYLLPKSLETARFLESEGERHMAIMRLQDNQTGNQKTSKIRWSHIKDALRDPKTWGWSFMYFCCALPSGGLAAFGPIITRGFGYSPLNTILIQIPMSVNSIILLWTATWIMNKLKIRYPIIAFLTLLPIGGAIGLLKVPRERSGVLLCCYYFANTQGILNPLILSWGNLNAAGRTKMVITTSLGFAFACLGNIIGPQVYLSREKPYYRTGLYVDIGCWCCISMMCFVMARYLAHLNKVQEMKRVSTGQRGNSQDTSIMSLKEAAAYKANLRTTIIEENPQGEEANKMDDLTDNENVNFHYVL
ncbi:hypothetical protein QFC22_003513 [Naganishia vaughanmartiniae]|uniref:Uncharacterized protein n=1 Tax=Naganishia vaughanmartiniae TaxID=1424756 RepID=A0ACC2X6N9_9TREE|nr:hypothetical protein QFC22_003513 [Naganishia vaughanmartiniae]